MALAWGTLSFIIKDPDEGVVAAVGLEARQPSLATVPAERQDLLLVLRLLLRFGFVKATLAAVVHLNKKIHTAGEESQDSIVQVGISVELNLVSLQFPLD